MAKATPPKQARRLPPLQPGAPEPWQIAKMDTRPPRPDPPFSTMSAEMMFRTTCKIAEAVDKETRRRNATDIASPYQWTFQQVLDETLTEACLRKFKMDGKR